ncbi:MAG: glycosyltransferase [Deltaproteobacteria bacterium]|nr:glycosyltransferase [Deltaproteobacteria bacterium]
MMDFLFWLAVVTLIGMILLGIEGVLGALRIEWLDNMTPLADDVQPAVSIIIPALNEEANIREALSSVLSLDYDPLEIIVINDRSTDGTGVILEEMRVLYPQLKVMQVSELPPGWLGKNHALQLGAARASGEYFLFTDADVVMEPSTLKRAMSRMVARGLDHLTLFFKAVLPSGLLQMVAIEFGASLVSYLRPWKASDPGSKKFIGIGAFNLVRSAAYREAGGHGAIRLCPVDDIMLGKLMKREGFRQECLYGYHFVAVKWYATVREMSRGLMKNTYAALEYSFQRLCLLTCLQLLVSMWPLWALFLTQGATRVVNGAIIVLQGGLLLMAAAYSGMNCRCIVWFPVTPYIRLYMTWRAVLKTVADQGIVWRGTFYRLDELKKARLR